MFSFKNSKTGGFKLIIKRRETSRYQITAVVFSLFLLFLVAYDIVYSSRILTRLFQEESVNLPQKGFNLSEAEANPKLNPRLPALEQSPEQVTEDLPESKPDTSGTTE